MGKGTNNVMVGIGTETADRRAVGAMQPQLPDGDDRAASQLPMAPSPALVNGNESKAMGTATGPAKVNLQPSPPPTDWLTTKAACAHAKCCRQTLWRWRRLGLRSGRGGRINRHDLDAWLCGTPGETPEGAGHELLTLREAAGRADVSRQTLWRWSNDGLKVERRGRFVRVRADVLDKYLGGRGR